MQARLSLPIQPQFNNNSHGPLSSSGAVGAPESLIPSSQQNQIPSGAYLSRKSNGLTTPAGPHSP